jgi:hypothetical protein
MSTAEPPKVKSRKSLLIAAILVIGGVLVAIGSFLVYSAPPTSVKAEHGGVAIGGDGNVITVNPNPGLPGDPGTGSGTFERRIRP